jgi:hypothetical protein
MERKRYARNGVASKRIASVIGVNGEPSRPVDAKFGDRNHAVLACGAGRFAPAVNRHQQQEVLPRKSTGFWLPGVADDRGGAPGGFRNQFEVRHQRWIRAVTQQQPVGITLYDGKNVVQVVGDHGADVPGWIGGLDRFTRAGYFFRYRRQSRIHLNGCVRGHLHLKSNLCASLARG